MEKEDDLRYELSPFSASGLQFESLCQPYPADALGPLVQKIDDVCERVAGCVNQLERLQLAALAERSKFLLSVYPRQGSTERSLIIGAIRYFLIHGDALKDTGRGIGLADDIQVMNHVLERLGFKNEAIQL